METLQNLHDLTRTEMLPMVDIHCMGEIAVQIDF